MTENLPALLPSQPEFQMFQTIAKNAQASGLYGGVGGEAKIFMIMLAARELGISPMLALNGGIWNIQGKIEISARLMNAMIRRAGHTMQITSTSTECTIKAKRADSGEEHTEKFTWAMAEKAGLSKGNVWQKYPEDMLYNRCMSRLARRLFSDVIGTAYVEGEISKEVETEKLVESSFEDITPIQEESRETHTVSFQMKMPPRLSENQTSEITEMVKLTDETYQQNLKKFMLDKWNATNYSELPESSYVSIMQSINNNIEMNKIKEVQ